MRRVAGTAAAVVAVLGLAGAIPAWGAIGERSAAVSGPASGGAPAQSATEPAASEPVAPAQSGLAPLPPMGWNSWNRFGCDINEDLILETADAMVESGMREAGYEYVNIDDCWMAPERDENGRLRADPVRFPSGIEAIADYVHAKGLKLGIYSSAGTATCQGLPASLGHEEIDAQTFADWGVDYLKYDNCNNQGVPARKRYAAMGEALAATGRPIVYSICEWGQNEPWLWGNEAGGDLWRTTGDISDNWTSVMSLLDQQVGLEKYSGPHGWNDPDMLEVGNGGMTDTEYRAHMSLWALLNAPLLAGNDLRSMSETTLRTLTDSEVVAVNQDWGGEQGSKRRDDGDTEVWAKPMSDGSVGVVLLNRSGRAQPIAAGPEELALPEAGSYEVRDVWAKTTRTTAGMVRAFVPSHGAAMFVVRTAEVTTAPPAVTLAPAVPLYAEKGEPVVATTMLHNDGVRPITRGRIGLDAPEGWNVSSSGSVTVPVVRPGEAAEVSWVLTPDDQVGAGTVAVEARASWYAGPDGHETVARTSFAVVEPVPAGEHHVSDLDWLDAVNGWGPVERDLSNGEQGSGDGNPLSIGGVTYEKGLGVHALSEVAFYTGSGCGRVSAMVGVDDEEEGEGSVAFEIVGDGAVLAASPTMHGGEPAVPLSADLSGVDILVLRVTDGGDGVNSDHGDWADARLTCG